MALNIRQVPSPNHYNGRNGHRVTHITLHIMVGRLAGTDAVFQRPSSQASAHYGIGGTGEIHQYVSEANGSYSDANFSSNNSTISIEHEGGMAGVPMTDGTPAACRQKNAQEFLAGKVPGVMAQYAPGLFSTLQHTHSAHPAPEEDADAVQQLVEWRENAPYG